MSTDVIITLEKLRCIREYDHSGHSEPYIWPFLMYIENLSNNGNGIQTLPIGNVRVIIKDNMKANEIADIPISVGRLLFRFGDILKIKGLILVVALLENDDTPDEAIVAGFQAFNSELHVALVENLPSLIVAIPGSTKQKEIIKNINTRVSDKVRSAIKAKLGIFDIFKNPDDPIGSDFISFLQPKESDGQVTVPIQSTRFTLHVPALEDIKPETEDIYEIEGKLEVKVVPLDLCQGQLNAVQSAQSLVNGLKSRLASLQGQLRRAVGEAKAAIIEEIVATKEELSTANASLKSANQALAACRSQWQNSPTVDTHSEVVVQ